MSCRYFGTPINRYHCADNFDADFGNFQGFVVADESADDSSSTTKEDPQMENLVDNISDLASKVLEIFGEKSFTRF